MVLDAVAAAAPTLAAWVHDLDPYAVKLWEGGPVRWYGLAYVAGFFVGWLLTRRVIRVGRAPLESVGDDARRLGVQHAADLTVMVAFGAVIGGRLGYCLLYSPGLFAQFDGSLPFWGVLKINNGGMASHGGIAGAVAAAWLFARRTGQPFGYVMDLTAFGAPLGLFFGRMANFVNGELYGRPCAADFPLAMKFPQELLEGQLSADQVDGLAPAAELVGVPATEWRGALWDAMDGVPGAQASVMETVQKVVASVPGRPGLAEALEPVLTPRHPSQLYAGLSEGLLLFALLAVVWVRPRKPLTVAAVFCLGYAVARVVNERFRLPDAQFIAEDGALPAVTRGQWLSVVVFVVGVVALVVAQRGKGRAAGGWVGSNDQGPMTNDQEEEERVASDAD